MALARKILIIGGRLTNSLILINKINDYLFGLYQTAIQLIPMENVKYITQYQGIGAFLQAKGMDCDDVNVVVNEAVVKNKPFLSKIANSKMFGTNCIPGTSLETWKVLMHDRFHQFMRFKDFDSMHEIVDAYDYGFLVVPIDVNDHLAQYLMRKSEKQGIRCIGVQVDMLRTKENLDAYYQFEKMVVQSESDKEFLVERKNAAAEKIIVVENQNTIQQTGSIRLKRKVLNSQFKLKFGFPALRCVLFHFCIRHIWECREVLNALTAHKQENPAAFTGVEFMVAFDSRLEEKEWPILFKQQSECLNIRVLAVGQPIVEVMLASDMVMGFRVNEVLEMADAMGIPTVLYDPCLFNRSDKLLSRRTGIRLMAEKPFPAGQWLEGGV